MTIEPADIGLFNGTTWVRLVPPPDEGELVIPPGGLQVNNRDNITRKFTVELRKGSIIVNLFNQDVEPDDSAVWPKKLMITSKFDGVFGRVTTIPTTQPTFYYLTDRTS